MTSDPQASHTGGGEGQGDAWHPTTRFAFRFLALYVLLYTLPFPVDAIWPSIPLAAVWDPLVPWVGAHVLRLAEPITIKPNGSGDTTYNYVQVAIMAALAVAGALVWSVMHRKRVHYRGLARWLVVGTRYYLASVMLGYGFVKIMKSQFPYPGLERLLQPFGDASPMGLAWAFLGYSAAYNVFMGGAEALAGLLLLFRRTATLGALVAIGVLSNIVMLNFCYDIPVKLFSAHLLAMAVGLAALDARRLVNFLLLNRPAAAVSLEPHFTDRRWNVAATVAKGLVVTLYLVQLTTSSISNYRQWGDGRAKPALQGLYVVESFVRDGEAVPPIVTEASRWRHFIVDRQGRATAQRMDGSYERYVFKPDLAAGKAELGHYDVFTAFDVYLVNQERKPQPPSTWTCTRPSAGVLQLEGDLDGRRLAVTLRARETDFLLVNRGFRWVNETPFNR